MHTHDFQSLKKKLALEAIKGGGGIGPMHMYLVLSPESQHLHSSRNTIMQGLCPAPASSISDWRHSCYESSWPKTTISSVRCHAMPLILKITPLPRPPKMSIIYCGGMLPLQCSAISMEMHSQIKTITQRGMCNATGECVIPWKCYSQI